jgi:hypothetical protein
MNKNKLKGRRPQLKTNFMNNCYKPLPPDFVTGLVDAEGCFIISIYINRKLKTG